MSQSLAPEVVVLCAELLKLVSIIRMGLEPNERDLQEASHAAHVILATEPTTA